MISGVIPNQFHFVFGLRPQRRPFHLAHYLCLESCLQVNRPKAIYFYYQHEPYGPYWEAIRRKLKLERVRPNTFIKDFRYNDSLIRKLRYAHHSDFIRLEKLLERGGIYADIDTLFVRPLRPDLFKHAFVLGREPDVLDTRTGKSSRSLCNAFIMSSPGAEFGRRWLEAMPSHFDGSWSNHSTLLPQSLADRFPELIHIEPQRSFYRYPPSTVGFAALFEDYQPIPNEVYSIHLWAHLWWEKARVDFTYLHQGRLNKEFVSNQTTTYSIAARPFLPDASVPDPKVRLADYVRDRIESATLSLQREIRFRAGLAIYPLLRRIWSKASQRLSLARGHRAYTEFSKEFKLRNLFENAILRNITEGDEYGIFDERFNADEVVIDVGAHIGVFSRACHWLGSRNIHAFEAEPTNYALLQHNLAGLNGISLTYAAVFSGMAEISELTHSGHVFSNTGGGSVIFGQNLFEFAGVGHLKPERLCTTAPLITFDDVLNRFNRVRLLKLDCEGSEYPILLTSKCLHKVDRIVGEYHVIDDHQMDLVVPAARVDGFRSYDGETIREKLTAEGFNVTIIPKGTLGLFNAVRRPSDERGGGDGAHRTFQ